MSLRVNRVPGVVTRSLRKGTISILPGTIDASFVPLGPFVPVTMTPVTSGFYDGDYGIYTDADVIGGTMPNWPGTEFDAADDYNVTHPLARFVDAT